MRLQQWNAHFFLLTSTKLYYTDETSLFSQNDAADDDEDAEEKEEEDNVTNAHMEVQMFSLFHSRITAVASIEATETSASVFS